MTTLMCNGYQESVSSTIILILNRSVNLHFPQRLTRIKMDYYYLKLVLFDAYALNIRFGATAYHSARYALKFAFFSTMVHGSWFICTLYYGEMLEQKT